MNYEKYTVQKRHFANIFAVIVYDIISIISYCTIISLREIFAENKFIFGTYFRNHIETSFNIGVLLQCDFTNI